jgi:hypothetical protein
MDALRQRQKTLCHGEFTRGRCCSKVHHPDEQKTNRNHHAAIGSDSCAAQREPAEVKKWIESYRSGSMRGYGLNSHVQDQVGLMMGHQPILKRRGRIKHPPAVEWT